MEKTVKVGVGPKDAPEVQVSAAEFILEDCTPTSALDATKTRLHAGEKQPTQAESHSTRRNAVPARPASV